MASVKYFDSNTEKITLKKKWKSVMEMHVITRSTNLHVQLLYFHIDK